MLYDKSYKVPLTHRSRDLLHIFIEVEHAKWMNGHLIRRKGERKDALKRGRGLTAQ